MEFKYLKILLILLILVSCKGTVDLTSGDDDDDDTDFQICGNSIVEGTESCDGNASVVKDCTNYGYVEGAISCNSNCTFNMTECSGFSSTVIIDSVDTPTISKGDTLTINGSGFGDKNPPEPSLWDDFEGHTNATAVTVPIHGVYDRVGLSQYDNTESYSGSLSAMSYIYDGATQYPGLVSDWIDTEGFTKNGFASMKFFFLSDFVPGGDQPMEICPHHIKLIRVNSYDPDATHGYPNFNIGKNEAIDSTPCPGFNGRVNDGLVEGFYTGGFDETLTNDADWNSIQIYNHIGDLDTPNGFIGRRINGELYHDADIVTYPTIGSETMQEGLRNAYFAGLIKREGYDVWIWLDDVYADFTLARVEIEGLSGVREMQIPETWATDQITVKFNSGKYPSGTQVMLYVYNEGNVVSNAVTVLIGD